ncbi:hypothetical protein [Serratia fonticola]
MKRVLTFVKDHLAVALILPLLTGVGTAIYIRGEIEAGEYREIAMAWPRLSSQTKAVVSDAMIDGKLTHWEFADIRPLIINETHMLSRGNTPILSLEEEKDQLRALK